MRKLIGAVTHVFLRTVPEGMGYLLKICWSIGVQAGHSERKALGLAHISLPPALKAAQPMVREACQRLQPDGVVGKVMQAADSCSLEGEREIMFGRCI